MSESVDTLFNKAIDTIQLLSSNKHYLPRPPMESRIKLYGLYKQATQGDLRDLANVPESGVDRLKYESWLANHGLDPTLAKVQYVACLLGTMKLYENDENFRDSKLLFDELEYLWDQFKEGDNDQAYHQSRDRYELVKWQNNVNYRLNQLTRLVEETRRRRIPAEETPRPSRLAWKRWILELVVMYFCWKHNKELVEYATKLRTLLNRLYVIYLK
ncbi:unnamed protein product [Kuraishia capsulata CBS 1993]|uniref:ACB domain-containing protein n=1 Tax=Kuraishia capsulata CBS 1993 TaxID=1382522 RepID=W6MXS4_9ASCO|nr:uncharacterized protein KUCA_T00005383001 [Kuraishia capsulata CBS 1993]CDK29395.1 unnamed protein product [Kuraishia capsulata CBS 1993]